MMEGFIKIKIKKWIITFLPNQNKMKFKYPQKRNKRVKIKNYFRKILNYKFKIYNFL
jgi:hypothetical protein